MREHRAKAIQPTVINSEENGERTQTESPRRGGRVGQLGCDSSAAAPVVGVRAYFLVLQALKRTFIASIMQPATR